MGCYITAIVDSNKTLGNPKNIKENANMNDDYYTIEINSMVWG